MTMYQPLNTISVSKCVARVQKILSRPSPSSSMTEEHCWIQSCPSGNTLLELLLLLSSSSLSSSSSINATYSGGLEFMMNKILMEKVRLQLKLSQKTYKILVHFRGSQFLQRFEIVYINIRTKYFIQDLELHS